MNDLLYVIPANSKKEDIIATLKQHPEIKFVSLVGIDLAGNDTDEKIPMRVFLEDIDSFYNGSAVQTDGSSVVLTGIATLNNAKVDMPIDPTGLLITISKAMMMNSVNQLVLSAFLQLLFMMAKL